MNGHPTVEEIAAYLSGKLSPDARTEVESHLSGCADCRGEVTSARKLMGERSLAQRYWIVPGLAAAVLLIGVLMKPLSDGDKERAPRSRAASEQESIALVSPRADASREGLVFAWRSAGSGALYALNLSDSTGNTVWESQTADTALALPHSVTLSPGTLYLWYIDASTPNGMTATSGVHSFRAGR